MRFSKKGSRLIVIFIITALISGSILTYLSITNISNYRELIEKKIAEEELDIVRHFSSDFRLLIEKKLEYFFDQVARDTILTNNELSKSNFEATNSSFVKINEEGSFLIPYFTNEGIISLSKSSSQSFLSNNRTAEKKEFIDTDYTGAIAAYSNSLSFAGNNVDSAYVYNALARLYSKMSQRQNAIESYKELLSKFHGTFNASGFPYSYFSMLNLLKLDQKARIEHFDELIYDFLMGLKDHSIPMNDTTEDLLNQIENWLAQNRDVVNSERLNELVGQLKESLAVVTNFKHVTNNSSPFNQFDSFQFNNQVFTTHKPLSTESNTVLMLNKLTSNYYGLIVELEPLFEQVIQKMNWEVYDYEYQVELTKGLENELLRPNNIVMRSQFSTLFSDQILQLSLINDEVIDREVLRRKISFGIGMILILGIAVLGLYLLIQNVKRDEKIKILRKEFVSNVTHELKTPLTSIHMFAEALSIESNALTTKQKKYTDIIVKESEKLKRMIENILEFSRKEDDKLRLNLERSNIFEIVQATLKEMSYFLEINAIKVNAELEENLYAVVSEEGLKLALSNLISNAIKYASGSKTMNVRLYKKKDKIYIEVQDFGMGIARESLDLIFEKFFRVNTTENETTSGTGLGLTVAKAIIEEQNGELLVESTLGKGCTFTIVLRSCE